MNLKLTFNRLMMRVKILLYIFTLDGQSNCINSHCWYTYTEAVIVQLTKVLLQQFRNNLKTIALAAILFCVEINNGFRSLYLKPLNKYFKCTICDVFSTTFKMRCHMRGVYMIFFFLL